MSAKHLTAWVNTATGEIMSPKGILVWPNLLEARLNKQYPNNPPKYSVTLLIPKGANIDAIKTEIARAGEDKYGKDFRKKIPKENYPIQPTSGHEKLKDFAAEYPIYLKASSSKDFPPFIVGPNAKEFAGDASDIYSGRWAIIAGAGWGWGQNFGVGWNLGRVQLLDHGEVLPVGGGGPARTVDGFEAVEVAAQDGGGAATTADDVFGDQNAELNDELGI